MGQELGARNIVYGSTAVHCHPGALEGFNLDGMLLFDAPKSAFCECAFLLTTQADHKRLEGMSAPQNRCTDTVS